LAQFAQDFGFTGSIRVSAKTDHNVTPMMAQLTKHMLVRELTEQAHAQEAEEA
jgi:hypothetical protein